jgi:hypothetical protein
MGLERALVPFRGLARSYGEAWNGVKGAGVV